MEKSKLLKLLGSKDAVELFQKVMNGIMEPFKPFEKKEAMTIENDKMLLILDLEIYEDGIATVMNWSNGERNIYAVSERLLNSYYTYSLLSTIGYRSHFIGVHPTNKTDMFIKEFHKDKTTREAIRTIMQLTQLVVEEQNIILKNDIDLLSADCPKTIEILAYRTVKIPKPIGTTEVLKQWSLSM